MRSLKVTTCQAANTVAVSRAIAGYIRQRLGLAAEFVDDLSWRERYLHLEQGAIHVAWICGFPYVRLVDRPDPKLALLAAPVMEGERYQNRPIYFSDVIAHRDSHFSNFADLRGASWAYNEPGSQSGFNVVRYHLATNGEQVGFFERVVGTGSHRNSVQWVVERRVDAAAIDSTVLEWEMRRRPEIRSHIRVIDRLGPSPSPPWVASRTVSPELRQKLGELLQNMHRDEQGSAILARGHIYRLADVADQDYNLIRQMIMTSAQVRLVKRDGTAGDP